MVILALIYAIGLGITGTCAFLFLGLFKEDQQILFWLMAAIAVGLIWPISVPAFLIYLRK